MAGKVIMLLTALLTLAFAVYVAQIPIPEDFPQPVRLKLLYAINFITLKATQTASFVGLVPEYDCLRWFADTFWTAAIWPWKDPGLDIKVEDRVFDNVPVKVYQPKGQKIRRAVVYYHGGGWVLGSPDVCDFLMIAMAKKLDALIISTRYRKAPEYPFPVPLEDCVRATTYLLDNARSLGVDPARVAVAGDSAGGNLAAAVAIKLKGRIKLQVLIFPALQSLDFRTPSYQAGGDPSLSPTVMASLWLLYAVGQADDLEAALTNDHVPLDVKQKYYTTFLDHSRLPKDSFPPGYNSTRLVTNSPPHAWKHLKTAMLNPLFAPLLADNSLLGGVAEAYVITCGMDVLRDDGILYVNRLREVSVLVTHAHIDKGVHGIMYMLFLDISKKETQKMLDFMEEKL